MDNSLYRTDKYVVTRTDGKEVGRTFVIEIDKDPQAVEALKALAEVYARHRPELAGSLHDLALLVERG